MLVYTTLDNIAENALRSGFTAMLYYMFSIMYYCVSAESYTQLVHTFIRLYDVCLFLFNDILRTLQRIKHFARLLGFIYDIVVVIIIVIFLIQRTQLLAVLNIMKLVSLHTHWLLFFFGWFCCCYYYYTQARRYRYGRVMSLRRWNRRQSFV